MRLRLLLFGLVLALGSLRAEQQVDDVPVYEDCASEMVTNSILANHLVVSHTGSLVEVMGNLVQLQGGQVIFELDEVPALGDPASAKNVIAGIFDYTCGHCISLRRAMYDIQRNYGDELAVIQLPGTRGFSKSRDVQLIMGVAFRADPELYKRVANGIYFGQVKPEPEVLEDIYKTEWGEQVFEQRMLEYQEAVMDALFRTRMLMEINQVKVGSMSLPQLMVGKHIALGSAKNVSAYYDLLNDQLELEKKFPVLQPLGDAIGLGRVYGGMELLLEFPLHNVGNAPLILGQLKMPQGGRVIEHPGGAIEPGGMKKLKLVFSIPTQPGPFEVPLEIVFNTLNPVYKINLVGESWIPLEILPEQIRFDRNRPGKIQITLNSDEPIRFGNPEPDHPSLQAAILDGSGARSTSATLQVEYDPLRGIPEGDGLITLPVDKGDSQNPWPPKILVKIIIE